MILVDLDPNAVKPGWTALLVVLLLVAAVVLLYLSMRRQLRKISVPRRESDQTPPAPSEPTAGTSQE